MQISMTDAQLYLAIGVPILFNATIVGVLTAYTASLNGRIGDVKTSLNARMEDMRDVLRAEAGKNQSELLAKLSEMDRRIDAIEHQKWKP